MQSKPIRRSTPGRPASRRLELETTLRRLILSGEWRPGSRLPSRRDLQLRYSAAPATLDRAVEQLAREGFIETRGRTGTFVGAHPPSTSQFAMVLPVSREELGNSGPAALFPNIAAVFQHVFDAHPGLAIVPYWGIRTNSSSADMERLRQDLAAHRLAGMIQVTPATLWPASVSLPHDFPRIAICTPGDGQSAEPDSVYFDMTAWHDAAIARVARHGRKRVAYFEIGSSNTRFEQLAGRCARHGLQTLPCWCQPISPTLAISGRYVAQLLMHAPPDLRPDALIIGDSSLATEVCRGLHLAGIHGGDDVHIIAHANIPVLPTVAVQVDWLGFRLDDAVNRCMSYLRPDLFPALPADSRRLLPLPLPVGGPATV